MKPRTRIQREVVRLSHGLSKPTESQTAYAFEHCFKHYAHRTKGGIITCTECGHRWKSKHQLAESICGCTLEKPLNFDPFGHARFAHLFVLYD